jgi:predicted ABC-class ATPase
LGADTLLIDEDTCATNFMIRDSKMMELVACDKEPITPFVRVVPSLKEQGISTILVVGGTGDFFDVADHVILMDSFSCKDATTLVQHIVQKHQNNDLAAPRITSPFLPIRQRYPIPKNMFSHGKVKVLARNIISYGDAEIDLSMAEQIISKFQANAIASILQYVARTGNQNVTAPTRSVNETLEEVERAMNEGSFEFLAPEQLNGSFIRPRKLEMGAAINRLPKNCIQQRTLQEN